MSGRFWFRLLSSTVCVALVSTGIEVASAATPADAPTAAVQTAASSDTERPDAVSAMLTARATGHRVEDLSQRTQTTQVFANPDSTWTSEQAPGPVRVRDAAGVWHDIDTTLAETGGVVSPRYAASDLKLSDGGDQVFAQVTQAGKQVEFKWPTMLPKPTLDGATATYANAVEGGDLVVTATASGFEHSIVLRERPASLDALAQAESASTPTPSSTESPASSGGTSGVPTTAPATTTQGTSPSTDPSASPTDGTPADAFQVETPISTDGAKLSETANGGVELQTKSGALVAAASQPLMWDASTDSHGDPTNVQPVDVTVTNPGQITPEGTTAGANPVMTLTPDQNFLADPNTVYPVTIDPTFTTTANGDTWIENAGLTSSQGSDPSLNVGTSDGGAHIARAYLQFANTSLAGKHITKATLWMRNWYSTSCTAADILATRIIDPWTVSGLTWANRPNFTNTNMGIFATAYGASGCPVNGANWDVTSIVDGWASGAFPNYGLQIKANTETYNGTFRRYRSLNNGDTSVDPRLVVTYNQTPNVPTTPVASAVSTYAPTNSDPVQTYVQSTTPTFSATVTDPDGGSLSTLIGVATTPTGTITSSCYTPSVASGQRSSCQISPALTEGGTYYVRATGWDGHDYSGGRYTTTATFTTPQKFIVASQTPTAPVVSCPTPYTNGSWASSAPSSAVSCTVTATGSGASAPGYIDVSADGQAAPTRVRIPQSTSSSIAQTTVTIPTNDGGHGITAFDESPSGKVSPQTTYGFGWGNMGMASPAAGNAETTTDTVAIDASGPPSNGGSGTPTATLKWRVAGTSSDYSTGWNTDSAPTLTVTNNATSGVHVTGTWDTRDATVDNAAVPSPITLDPSQPVLLDVQICVGYPGADSPSHCTWASGSRQILRVVHAFGGNFPTASVPGGQVALWTGELAVSGSDAAVTAPNANLSISRTASSFAGPLANPAEQVFGPGWNASLDGPGAGMGDTTVIDNTLVDGTIQLVDTVGDTMVFGASATPARRTTTDLTTGTWMPLDDDTQLSGTKLTVSGSGTGAKITVTDGDGTVTTYTVQSAPTTSTAGTFTVDNIAQPGSAGTTTYTRDGSGRITRMLAPVLAGVDCSTSMVASCRAMTITYATSTTATSGTPGDVAGQVKEIDQLVGGATPTSVALATYKYDGSSRLVSVTDPRNGLTTAYSYDGTSNRIASVTPAGLKPINYLYAPTNHKLARVTRDYPTTGTANLDTIVYGVPTTGHTGLPDMSQTGVSVWGQTAAPTYAAAVFGPQQPFSSAGTSVTTSDVDAAASGGAAWADASLSYTNADGQTLNTSSYGAGGWQDTSTTYDANQNPVRTLSAGDIAAIQAGTLVASQAGTTNVYNVSGSTGPASPTGTVVTDTYGTARWIRDASGNLVWASPHTHTDYDQGAPNSGTNPATGQGYDLPTTVTSDAVDPSTHNVVDTYSVKTTGYDNAVAGDTTNLGWTMGLVATNTTIMTGSAGSSTAPIISQTRYDASGRVISTSQAASSGSDDGTRLTYYYTAGTHPTVSACGNQPAWAGEVCQTTFAGSSPTLVTTTTASYDDQLNPLSTVENSGSVTRTTTNTYRADGKSTGVSIVTSGLTGSTAVGATTLGYDPATGLPTTTTTAAAGGNPGGTITTGYDSWGRQVTYTPATGETTTTNYDANGNVSSVVDPQGTTTYTYNGTDAAGNSEHRGLVTGISISRPSTSDVSITGAYDASGQLVLQKLPGGVIQRTTYDAGGQPTALSYSGQVNVVDPSTGAVTGTTQDSPWLGWSQDNDAQGRVRRDWTPVGAAFTGATASGASATGYARDYIYDRANRLVQVKDQTVPVVSAGGGVTNPDDTAGLQAMTTCQFRNYTFDPNGNRTSLTTTTAAVTQPCPTPGGTGAVTKTWSYDNGDRVTTAPGGGSYAYDAFGRATTVPQADTPQSAAGGSPGVITLGYYDTDAAQSINQSGATTVFGLDPAGRRSTSTTTPSSGSATTIARHYTDSTDNPGWTSTTTGTGSPSIERFAEGLDGNLGLTITGTTVAMAVVDLHGDQVSQITLPTSGNATGIDDWSQTDEYGNSLDPTTIGKTPTNGSGVSGGLGYGWLGGKQRATDTTGLVLMGARLYNATNGQFTSSDPVYRGNTTAYAYPQDPINGSDVTGQMCWSFCGNIWGGIKTAAHWVNDHVTVSFSGCAGGLCASATFNHGRLFFSGSAGGGNYHHGNRSFRAWGFDIGYTSTPLDQTDPVSVRGCYWDKYGGCFNLGTRGHHRHAVWGASIGTGQGFMYGPMYQVPWSIRLW
ncbi:MAG: hypothetical protein JWR35_3917 [Marmoricola sp.]|nr:hypothetical protein [Marmoricola sp.]